jgi:photoactive yellow protein
MNAPRFDDAELATWLAQADDAALDSLSFGAIGFGRDGRISRYNAWEARAAGFAAAEVRGQDLFVELAPCMNNYLVAARFEDAAAAAQALDQTLPYVLTFRMRPTPVHLRLLARPGDACRWVLVLRSAGSAA